jgi:four helix bundle protein
MFKFERLDVWRKAVDLYGDVAQLSKSLDRMDQFSLGDQMRRASLSISTNIAEATGREGIRESKHFFNIAKGSVYEVISLLFVMRSRGNLGEKEYNEFYSRCDEIARMLTGVLNR